MSMSSVLAMVPGNGVLPLVRRRAGAPDKPLAAAPPSKSSSGAVVFARSASGYPPTPSTPAASTPVANRRAVLGASGLSMAAALLAGPANAKVSMAEALEKYKAETRKVVAEIREVVEASVPGADVETLKKMGKKVKKDTEDLVVKYGLRCATSECTKMGSTCPQDQRISLQPNLGKPRQGHLEPGKLSHHGLFTMQALGNQYVPAEPSYVRFTDVLKELGAYRAENGESGLPTEEQRRSVLKGLGEVEAML